MEQPEMTLLDLIAYEPILPRVTCNVVKVGTDDRGNAIEYIQQADGNWLNAYGEYMVSAADMQSICPHTHPAFGPGLRYGERGWEFDGRASEASKYCIMCGKELQ